MARTTSALNSPEDIENTNPAARAAAISLSVIILSLPLAPIRKLDPLCFRSASGTGFTISFTEALSKVLQGDQRTCRVDCAFQGW